MEAIVLAGGKAERLGEAAAGLPKPLVRVGGRSLAAYQVGQLVRAGVTRVIVSCAAGAGELFRDELSRLGAEIVPAEEPEPLGRGGAIRYAARFRAEDGPVFALNGDELVDLDFRALLGRHEEREPAATITVVPLKSAFGIVELSEDDVVRGFREAPRLPYWVSCGVYVLREEALERFPEQGDHEVSTFPELAREGRLHAFRHEGTWITINTPKDLRLAGEFVTANPGWLPVSAT